MTRLTALLLVGVLTPAAASAQTIAPAPPVPPAAPAPRMTPAPPKPLVRPTPMPRPMPDTKALTGPMPIFDDMELTMHLKDLEQRLADMHFDIDINPMLTADIEAQVRMARDQSVVVARQSEDMARQAADRARQSAERIQEKFEVAGGSAYKMGLDALQQRQYERAITAFDRSLTQKSDRSDAALYWKTFAQYKLGRSDDALATIAQLRRDHPQSRYLADAKVLEADVRKMAGQPVNPANADDDEIKLLAIQGLSKSEQAVPLLEGVLAATNSLNVKKRALYVLALSDEPRAHQSLMKYAKGGGNPDLQIDAIRYLASRRDSKTTPAELREIYDSSSDINVKLAVIDAYRAWDDKVALVRIAGDRGATIDVRRSATSRLNGLADTQDVMALFQAETDPALRVQLVNLLASMGAVDQLTTIAKTDKDQSVRLRAVRVMGGQRNDKMVQALVALYGSESDKDVRRAVINALTGQSNADVLISLAKKETDLDLKRELVRRISDMAPQNKAAADYLMEQLK